MKAHLPLPTLTPLDHLLLKLRTTCVPSDGSPAEWRLFLGFSANNELIVATAKGTRSTLPWADVDRVAKREVVIVRALTIQAWKGRETARQYKEPYKPCWLPAAILMAVLDPVTQRIDGFHIRQSNGEELPSAGPDIIHIDDYVGIVQIAFAGAMPVFTPRPVVPVCPKAEDYKPFARPVARYHKHLEALIAAEIEHAQAATAAPGSVAEFGERIDYHGEPHHYQRAAQALIGQNNCPNA